MRPSLVVFSDPLSFLGTICIPESFCFFALIFFHFLERESSSPISLCLF